MTDLRACRRSIPTRDGIPAEGRICPVGEKTEMSGMSILLGESGDVWRLQNA